MNTGVPIRSLNSSAGSVGVRTATDAMRAAADSRSYRVMRSVTGSDSGKDAIAPAALRLVQRPVGFLQQHLGGNRIGAARERDTDGNGKAHGARARAEIEIAHLFPHTF